MAKLGILTLHGMGDVGGDFDHGLRKKLITQWDESIKDEITFEAIHYHPAMQGAQEATLSKMHLGHQLDYAQLREFFMYAFCDATTYHLYPENSESVYQKVHRLIKDKIEALHKRLEVDNCAIIVIAQSLGGQVISNYIWDVQNRKGIWREEEPSGFHKLEHLKLILTTGCNIPLFVGGLEEIQAIQPPNHDGFRWLNFFDKDDILGWPLRPLSESYKKLVTEDIAVNTGFTPFSHIRYWSAFDIFNRSQSFIAQAAREIEEVYHRIGLEERGIDRHFS